TEDHRTEAEQVVDVFVAIDIAQARALAGLDEQRVRRPPRPGRARRAVDAARYDAARRFEQVGTAGGRASGAEPGFGCSHGVNLAFNDSNARASLLRAGHPGS